MKPLRCGPRLLAACLLCELVAAPAAPATTKPPSPITEKNWRFRPSIRAIRSLVEKNETAIDGRKWHREDKEVCRSKMRAFAIDVTVIRDQRGGIRKYVKGAGTDDSAYTLEHHYDDRGRLRFALARAGAVNTSDETWRLYFAEDGREIWRHMLSSGPGYAFMRPPEFPDRMLVRDPVNDLAAPGSCE
jgi:hypothetical protein